MTNSHMNGIYGTPYSTGYNRALEDVLRIVNEVANDDLIDDAIKINSVRNRGEMWLKGGEQEGGRNEND